MTESEIIPREGVTGEVSAVVREMMLPVLTGMAEMIRHTNEALQAIALQQEAQTRRMDELEKQMSWSITVTDKQARYINRAIRETGKGISQQMGMGEKGAKAIQGEIRKALCLRYGVGKAAEIPRIEYQTAMRLIDEWSRGNKTRLMEIWKNIKGGTDNE